MGNFKYTLPDACSDYNFFGLRMLFVLALCRALLGWQSVRTNFTPIVGLWRTKSEPAAHMVLFDEWFCPGHVALPFFLLLGRHRDLLRSEVEDRSTLNSEVERRFVSIRNQRGGGGRKREEGGKTLKRCSACWFS